MVEQSDLHVQPPPLAYTEQVRQLLEHFYDFAFLQRQAAPQPGGTTLPMEGEGDPQALRRLLLEAIEALNPGPQVPFRALQARPYHLLHLRYIEGHTVQETARELGLSERQAYRDLRRAEESVTALLWARRTQADPGATPQRARQLSALEVEVSQLETKSSAVDIGQLLQRALRAVEQLAHQYGLQFSLTLPSSPLVLTLDALIAQQVLTATLSQVIRYARGDRIALTLAAPATLTIHYRAKSPDPVPLAANPLLLQLTQRLGWRYTIQPVNPQEHTLQLILHRPGPTVLVIDDNQGLVDLLDRYLVDHAYRVVAATSGRAGLALADSLQPSAILLDVMMPEMDGWEVLQTLRNRPQTRAIPIIVCSVFDDPELAYSLGASLFLSKPVTRDQVLAALRRLQIGL